MMMLLMLMMLVLLLMQVMRVATRMMGVLVLSIVVLGLRRTGMMMMMRMRLRPPRRRLGIAGGPIAELVVLPRAPVAEPHLSSSRGSSSRPATATAGTGSSRAGGWTTRRRAGRDVGPNIQAEAANVTDVGGTGRLGGMEGVATKGHLAGVAIGPGPGPDSGLLSRIYSSSSRGMSIPPLVLRLAAMLGGIVRRIPMGRRGRMAPPPGSAAGGHAPPGSEGGGPIRTHLRGWWAGQQSVGARDAAQSATVIASMDQISQISTTTSCNAILPTHRHHLTHNLPGNLPGNLPPGNILGHGLGHRGSPPAPGATSELRSDVGRVLPQRLPDLLPGLLVADVPPRPVLVLLEESAGGVQPPDPPHNVVGNVRLLQLPRLGT
mmetsp:Transcript_20790/g.59583  ORF Transcript_20790/g.59583 Transcript_20790/m.59583 type:complete len:377 (-) Transcript_20790:494-1624(-)